MDIRTAVKKALMPPTDSEQFGKIAEELTRLFTAKNEDYGGNNESVAQQMYHRYGDQYFCTMVMQKALRIEASKDKNFESVEDSYRDIACYAIMALIEHGRMARW